MFLPEGLLQVRHGRLELAPPRPQGGDLFAEYHLFAPLRPERLLELANGLLRGRPGLLHLHERGLASLFVAMKG